MRGVVTKEYLRNDRVKGLPLLASFCLWEAAITEISKAYHEQDGKHRKEIKILP